MTYTTFTCSTKTPNKYHPDNNINDIIKWVRYAKSDSDAISNLMQDLSYMERNNCVELCK